MEDATEVRAMHGEVIGLLKSVLAAKDFALLQPVFADDIRFGSCIGRPQVVQYLRHTVDLDSVHSLDIETRADRLIDIMKRRSSESHEPLPDEQSLVAVLFVQHGRIVELQVVVDRNQALTAAAAPPPPSWSGRRTRMARLAAVLPVRDLADALEHYRLLGFTASAYSGGGYGYAERDGLNVHFRVVPDLEPAQTTSAIYLYVDDADTLFSEWRSAGVSGQFFEPRDTEYGLREGAHIDLDGNLLRFGSPSGGKI